MSDPAKTTDQNILPVQALFNLDNSFNTFIGQGQPFYATVNPDQSGLHITDSTIDSTTIGATTPSTGAFTDFTTTTGRVTTSPTANTDIANKLYVDSIAQGLNPKQAVKCATTANITLSGLQTIDTYTTLAGDRVLVKNQTAQAENGIYIASTTGWTRSTDMDVWSEVPGAYTVILYGSVNLNTSWVSTSADTGTINVTPITFVQFSGSGSYYAGTGLTLASNTFSITNTGVTAGAYGSASKTLTATVNAQGQLTVLSASDIAIAASQITSGTIDTARISGSYTGITGVGTLTAGTWNASTIGVAYGGTGATTLTGYVKGSGTSAFTASSTIPTTDLSGTITNAQLQNSTISGVSLGSNLFSLTIGSGLSGTSYNGSAAVTITNSSPMVYPSSGIPNSTGTAWGTSYSTSGTGTVVALATSPLLTTPTISGGVVGNSSPYLDFTGTTAPTYVAGRLWYDSASYALAYYNNTTNNIVHIGQELQQQARNSTGSTILKGQVVYISGSTGQVGNIILAQANAYTTSQVIGVANQDIANNTNGWIVTQGTVTGLDTSTLTAGNPIYLSATTPGALTQTEPSTPNYAVHMGVCLYSNNNNGKLYINPMNQSIDTGYIIGQIAIAQGGTNGTATPTAGAVAYGSGSAYAFTSVGTTGQVLTSNGTGTPTWTTPTAYATVTDDTTTNATRYPLFAAATSGNLTTEYTSSTKYQFNPSTGVLTATGFSGSGASLTSIPNSALVNSSITVGSTAISLGSSATTLAGLSSVTSTTFVGSLSGNASTATTATTATNATNVAITDNTTSSSTWYPVLSAASTGNNPATTSSTKFSFVPSTGTLTVSTLTPTNALAVAYGGTGTSSPSLVAGTNVTITGTWPNQTINASGGGGGSGTVTSVAATVPSFLSISGSPITTSGTLAISYSGTALPVANGGTGQTTASAAFNALSPITTTGDLILGNGTNSATRLGIGANGYVLTSNGTTASWQASSGGGLTQAKSTAISLIFGL